MSGSKIQLLFHFFIGISFLSFISFISFLSFFSFFISLQTVEKRELNNSCYFNYLYYHIIYFYYYYSIHITLYSLFNIIYYDLIYFIILLFYSFHDTSILLQYSFSLPSFSLSSSNPTILKTYYTPLYILYDDYISVDSSRTCLFSVKTYGSKCKMTSSLRRGASTIIFAAWCFYRSSRSFYGKYNL